MGSFEYWLSNVVQYSPWNTSFLEFSQLESFVLAISKVAVVIALSVAQLMFIPLFVFSAGDVVTLNTLSCAKVAPASATIMHIVKMRFMLFYHSKFFEQCFRLRIPSAEVSVDYICILNASP